PTMLQTELGLTKQQTAPRIVLFNLGMLAGALGAGWLASKKGPALAIALPSLLALPVLPLYVKGAAAGAFVGGLFGVGSSGVTPALLTQLFPAEVRARCVGLVYHLGAVTAAFIPTLVAVLHDRVGWSYAWAIGVVAAVAELLVVFWVRIVVTSPAAALSRPVLTRAP
ncbi:MAG: MFS transporter, partial [Myxococcaceae bacterium]